MSRVLHVGLVINPLAGLGGSLALKGSDGQELLERYDKLDQKQRLRGENRVVRALGRLGESAAIIRFSTWAGAMGENALRRAGLLAEVLGHPAGAISGAADTKRAARVLLEAGVDLLVFAGGDGTARDVFDAAGSEMPALGIPAGVKMHSGVFAVSAEAAGDLLSQLATGGLVGLGKREVRDIDEVAFRQGIVRSCFYGELLVPGEGRYLQHTKVGGRESEELVAAEIAAFVVERMVPGRIYLIGPGSTTAAIMEELHLPNTLLGVDVVRDGELLASDADEAVLLDVLGCEDSDAELLVTAIGGQGHVFGRGNQQFSPRVIRAVGLDRITVVAAKSKIAALEGRPLLVDTDEPALDKELSGYRQILTGYDDHILYRLATIE